MVPQNVWMLESVAPAPQNAMSRQALACRLSNINRRKVRLLLDHRLVNTLGTRQGKRQKLGNLAESLVRA